ncbi:MAG: CdaR family protein [Candidatus Neomarinimicrobiota bacterium]
MGKTKVSTSFFNKIVFPIGAFFLAVLLWLFVVSGNNYTMMLDIPIEARNLNAQKAYLEEVPDYASVILEGKGRDLFKSFILKNYSESKLVLDLEGISQEYEFILNEYFEKNPSKVVLPPSHHVRFVEVVYPNRIKIKLDEILEKKVPIISNINVIVKDGHVQIGKTKFEPDSINIIGPRVELDKITSVYTIEDTLNNLFKTTESEIDLLVPNRLIKYSFKRVKYLFNIQHISERIIVDIPVNVINKIKGIRVFPSPQTVSLTLVGGVEQIAKIKPLDISVTVDFSLWELEKNFYMPEVLIPFDILSWKNLSPRSIELGVARESK